jgi:hypothetical protein
VEVLRTSTCDTLGPRDLMALTMSQRMVEPSSAPGGGGGRDAPPREGFVENFVAASTSEPAEEVLGLEAIS